MIALIISPFAYVLLVYLNIKVLKYFKEVLDEHYLKFFILHSIFVLLYPLLLIASYFLKEGTSIHKAFVMLGYNWLGIFLYYALGIIIGLVICLIYKKIFKDKYNSLKTKCFVIIFSMIFALCLSTIGLLSSNDLHISEYEIKLDKKASINELNVVFLSDIHLGYNYDEKDVYKLVETINSNEPDIVLIGGDLFNNSYKEIANPELISYYFSNIKTKYGVYTVLGNHDVSEKIFLGFTFNYDEAKTIDDDMLKFLNDSHINIIYDDYIEVEDIIIYGRPDRSKINFNNEKRLTPLEVINCIDTSKANIVIDHEPTDYKDFKELGVDIYLCGHTHDGQLWPFNLTSKLIWNNSTGYKLYGNMHNIVSSGVGTYGIKFRTGTKSEICKIKIVLE